MRGPLASRSPVRPELLAVSAQFRPARPVPRVVSARQRWVLRAVSVLPRPAELGQRHPARMEQLAA